MDAVPGAAHGAVEVFRSQTSRPAQERALVLASLGLAHALNQEGASFVLRVPYELAPRAHAELEQYGKENVDWPPQYNQPPLLSSGKTGITLYALVILLMFPVGQYGLFGLNFWEAGRMHVASVRGGEGWRAVTALTLHVDLGHLLGNLIFGAAFGLLAAHPLGGGLTWLGAVMAGSLGNLATIWIHPPEHMAVGASTAVFALLGMLAAYEWVRRHALNYALMRRFAPMMGAGVLFGYLGVGGENTNTDVLAHITGAGAGVMLGLGMGLAELPAKLDESGQRLAAALALGIVVAAWAVALT